MFGLGKERSRLGKWMDRRGIKQEWLISSGKLSKGTVTSACNDEEYIPSGTTMKKIIDALRTVDPHVKASDFWEI